MRSQKLKLYTSREPTMDSTSSQSIAVSGTFQPGSLVQSVGLIDEEGIGDGTSVGFGVGLVDSEGELVGDKEGTTQMQQASEIVFPL